MRYVVDIVTSNIRQLLTLGLSNLGMLCASIDLMSDLNWLEIRPDLGGRGRLHTLRYVHHIYDVHLTD